MLPSVAPGDPPAIRPRRGVVPQSRTSSARLAARDAAVGTVGAGALGFAISVAGHSTVEGVITGGLVWVVVSAGVALRAWLRSFRAGTPDEIDPWALPEPWRQVVAEAVASGRRFRATAASLAPGPLRDRVETMQQAVDGQVNAVWDTARQGAILSGDYPPGGRHRSVDDLTASLEAAQRERSNLGEGSQGRREELDRAEEAFAVQLREARRAQSAARDLRDALGVTIARLDGAVTDLARLAGQSAGEATVEGVGASIEAVSDELTALRTGLAEVTGASPLALEVPDQDQGGPAVGPQRGPRKP